MGCLSDLRSSKMSEMQDVCYPTCHLWKKNKKKNNLPETSIFSLPPSHIFQRNLIRHLSNIKFKGQIWASGKSHPAGTFTTFVAQFVCTCPEAGFCIFFALVTLKTSDSDFPFGRRVECVRVLAKAQI